MEKLFIQVDTQGNPVNHPATEVNLMDALGMIPDDWEPFVRVAHPTLPSVYHKITDPTPVYQKIDGVWTDTWQTEMMTDEEKALKQQMVKDEWISQPQVDNFSAWTFSEELCRYVPPSPRPRDGKDYFWQGNTNSWVETPSYPTDNDIYHLDYATGQWIQD